MLSCWITSSAVEKQRPCRDAQNQFKNELQTNYSMSDSINYKYRALVIRNPKLNHSGEYMCSVQTYDSFDRRMARFQIVGKYVRTYGILCYPTPARSHSARYLS